MTNFLCIPVADTNDKCLPLLTRLIDSVRDQGYYDNGFQVILAFDNCSKKFLGQVEKYLETHPTVIGLNHQSDKNLNYTKNINRAFRVAYELEAKYITALNQDCILPDAKVFKSVMERDEAVVFAAQVDDPEAVAAQTIDYAFSLTPTQRASGFCYTMHRSVVDKIGFLDERFPAGCDDDDLCIRAHLRDIKCLQSTLQVNHELKTRTNEEISTTGAYTSSSLGVALKALKRKYSVPDQITHDQLAGWVLDNYTWIEQLKEP